MAVCRLCGDDGCPRLQDGRLEANPDWRGHEIEVGTIVVRVRARQQLSISAGSFRSSESVRIRVLLPYVRQEKWATDGHGFTRINMPQHQHLLRIAQMEASWPLEMVARSGMAPGVLGTLRFLLFSLDIRPCLHFRVAPLVGFQKPHHYSREPFVRNVSGSFSSTEDRGLEYPVCAVAGHLLLSGLHPLGRTL